jgi:hypothetical protein
VPPVLAAAEAQIAVAAAPAAATPPPLPDHQSVDPGRSAGWWADAALMLWRHPLRWLALGGVVMAVLGGVAWLPWVGVVVSAWLTPLLLGGWVRAAHDARSGTAPGLRGLFAGFTAPHRRPLALLGAALAGSTLLVLGVSRGLGLDALAAYVALDGPEHALAQAQMGTRMLALLVLLTFSLFVSAALWFAPALVVLRGATPLAAARASLRAVRDNALTFLLFAVVQLLLSAAGVLPYHLGWVVMAPVMLLTTYVSYGDVFEG